MCQFLMKWEKMFENDTYIYVIVYIKYCCLCSKYETWSTYSVAVDNIDNDPNSYTATTLFHTSSNKFTSKN